MGSRSVVQDWLTCRPPWAQDPDSTDEEPRNLPPNRLDTIASHLHLAGLSMREISSISYKKGQAYREEVYKGTNFDSDNLYGPLTKKKDSSLSIDWRMVDAISIVMALNVRSAWHQVNKCCYNFKSVKTNLVWSSVIPLHVKLKVG